VKAGFGKLDLGQKLNFSGLKPKSKSEFQKDPICTIIFAKEIVGLDLDSNKLVADKEILIPESVTWNPTWP
jgi:hypothetical protein